MQQTLLLAFLGFGGMRVSQELAGTRFSTETHSYLSSCTVFPPQVYSTLRR